MLVWAVLFGLAAVVAAIPGFGGFAERLADIAKILFALSLIGLILVGVLALVAWRKLS